MWDGMPEIPYVSKKIYTEWLLTLREYYDDLAKCEKGTMDDHYYCEICIPVKRK